MTPEEIRAEINRLKKLWKFRLEYDPNNLRPIDYITNRINKLEAQLEESDDK